LRQFFYSSRILTLTGPVLYAIGSKYLLLSLRPVVNLWDFVQLILLGKLSPSLRFTLKQPHATRPKGDEEIRLSFSMLNECGFFGLHGSKGTDQSTCNTEEYRKHLFKYCGV
jgi:hypothetical protein